MLLAFDVGNSNIVLGCMENGLSVKNLRFSVKKDKQADYYWDLFGSALSGCGFTDFEGAVISSVVPCINDAVADAAKRLTKSEPIMVSYKMKHGLTFKTEHPEKIGQDLIVDAAEAYREYRKPCIVFDFGTATTICVVDENGAFIGRIIMPGIKTSHDALIERTSQLMSVNFTPPPSIFADNTADAVKGGIIFGNAAMIDGMIDRIQEQMLSESVVIATGGLAGCVVPFCHRRIIYDPELLLKGLWHLYRAEKE